MRARVKGTPMWLLNDLAGELEAGQNRLSDAGLAHRSRDRAAPRLSRAIARRRTQVSEGGQGVVHQDRRARRGLRDQRARRAGFQRRRDEFMTVAFAAQGDEQVARLDLAAVDGDALSQERRTAQTAVHGGGDFRLGPQEFRHDRPSEPPR